MSLVIHEQKAQNATFYWVITFEMRAGNTAGLA